MRNLKTRPQRRSRAQKTALDTCVKKTHSIQLRYCLSCRGEQTAHTYILEEFMKNILRLALGAALTLSLTQVYAQATATKTPAKSRYASAGTIELSGTIGFASQTISLSGSSASSTITTFSLGPNFAAFVTDAFFLGVTGAVGQIFYSQSIGGVSATQLSLFASPGFAFDTGGAVFPYVAGLIGYGSLSSGSASISGIGFGGRGGIKFAIADGALLDLGLQYLSQNYSQSGSSSTLTYGTFSVVAGFSVFF